MTYSSGIDMQSIRKAKDPKKKKDLGQAHKIYQNYIDTNTSLYHLERQSQNLFNDTSWKFKLTIFNGIQHSKRWDSTIVKLLEQGSK